MPDASRREALLDQAVRAGKFPPQRRAHWSELYDRDPAGTERVLSVLASSAPLPTMPAMPTPPPRITRTSVPRRPTYPEAAMVPVAASQPLPPGGTEITPELVAGWSRQLFPATAARASAGHSRIQRALD
jgi:hypothetical protein